jgi:putative hydrolase of the HAD superfamily
MKKRDGRAAADRKFEALILDYGEVLCHRPTPEHIARIAAVFGIPAEDFPTAYVRSRAPYDRGDVSPSEYWRHFASCAGVELKPGEIEQLRGWDVEMWSQINGAMTDWVSRVRASGIKTAILSNMQADMAKHARANFAWLKEFDAHIFSCEKRATKPDPAIYQACIAALNVEPSRALFVDDREENLEGARACGIIGIRFESMGQLANDLRALGFRVLPSSTEHPGPARLLQVQSHR